MNFKNGTKKYVFVRMPRKTYERYKQIQLEMKKDIAYITSKPIEKVKLPMTRVFKAIVTKSINESDIVIGHDKLLQLARRSTKK